MPPTCGPAQTARVWFTEGKGGKINRITKICDQTWAYISISVTFRFPGSGTGNHRRTSEGVQTRGEYLKSPNFTCKLKKTG
ncbi:hypothetical protein BDV25DRAFT_167687 [Aspergillus avenaceus]|uniref:Uncharacterized protein n=1 Tax=Aspergillus avenaceus TaxID=36643 RepID=A0A5N6TCM6_ASPAV|nr:hypothetical protein BDV25DRAFT_167687 [Aspergillus avenaceus]